MDPREKQIIRSNEKYLRDNMKINEIISHLISDSIISIDDAERIEKEVTSSDQVRKLLRIVEMHPDGYLTLISALKKENMSFIADELEKTVVNKEDLLTEQREWDAKIIEMLKKRLYYHLEGDVLLTIVEDVLKEEFRMIGEHYNVHIDHLKRLVNTCFPGVDCKKTKKKGKDDDEDDADGDVKKKVDNDNEKSKAGTDERKLKVSGVNRSSGGISHPLNESTCSRHTNTNRIQLQHLSSSQLADLLKGYTEEYSDLPDNVTEIIQAEGVNGKIFKKLERQELVKTIFPDFTRVQIVSLMCIRDDICKDEKELESNSDNSVQNEMDMKPVRDEFTDTADEGTKEYPGHFRESFRPFDKESRNLHTYRQNALLTSFNTRPGNLIDPVHVFSYPQKSKLYKTIADHIVEFAAACMNERSNGTIHFGIQPNECCDYQIDGKVIGIPLSKEKCLKHIYDQLDRRFYKEQQPIVRKCIRPPQFLQVTTSADMQENVWVLEVDIVPLSTLIGDEAFFIKQRQNDKPVLFLYGKGSYSPSCISDEESQAFMVKNKNKYTEMRKAQEMIPETTTNNDDLRQKILELLCSGDETMSSDTYPLLFLGPFDSSSINNIDFENFQFMIDLDANAIFDFDYSTGSNGIFQFFENDKEEVFKALTTDNFDPSSEENNIKKDSYSNMLDDVRNSAIKPWVFCNGYEPLEKLPMKIMDWKQKRSKGFKEAIRFYRQELPSGRGLAIFFLFSKDYEEMLEAANDVIIDFKDQWIVFAENNAIAGLWCTELSRRHIADKKTVEQRTIVGMPWKHVNQTLQQLTASKPSMRCEIPTTTGAFCYLKAKTKNELYDLEILSRNECDNYELTQKERKKLRREEEERFYKGGNVSWWNFWFNDHVLKRDVHERIKDKVEGALKGKGLDDDNKVGLVNIFHQPGSGGSTTARHILWDLKTRYRCCIVKHITDQTIDQITSLRNYEEKEDPKPPLVLVENRDEERVAEMCAILQHKARIVARRNTDVKVFCVLLLCTRRANIPQIDKTSEALKHELSANELQWFSDKYHDLMEQYRAAKNRPDPKFLISFNILKQNFNHDYIRDAAAELVKGVTNSNEQKLLKYLSLLNTFDLEGLAIPVSAFDPIMRKYPTSKHRTERPRKELNKTWEQTISQPLQILINRNVRAGYGSQLQGLSIINAVFADEILKCFTNQQKLSDIVFELFESEMFIAKNMSRKELDKVIGNIMKKREDKDDIGRMKFSPLIMRLLDDEKEETATKVLTKGFDMTEDPMICQQVARLYIHCKNWKKAASFASIATSKKQHNSFLWDTYGQVYAKELYSKYEECVQEDKKMTIKEIEEVIEIAQNGIHKFHMEQKVSECERYTKPNDAGYFGELRIIILLLDTLRFSPLGRDKNELHKYLVDKTYMPKKMPPLKQESIEFLKSLEQRVESAMKMIEDRTTQFKDDKIFAVFGQQDSWRKGLPNLRENLNSYFGEDSDAIPENYSDNDMVDYRRRRVRKLGGSTLYNLIRIADRNNLKKILDHLVENNASNYWKPFDAICLINVVLAMKILNIEQSEVTYKDLVRLSKKCYEKITSPRERDSYLEAYMYYIVFNWPTETRQSQNICPVEELKEAIRNWKTAFHNYHPRQKDGTAVRRRETTIFFLGKGTDMDSIIHYDELVDPHGKKFVKGDTVWESEDFVNKLLRLPGTLVNEGSDVSYQMEQRTGGKTPFNVPTSFPIGNRLLWQKRVMFVLGFSWGGIKAYDVRQHMPEQPVKLPLKPLPVSHQSTSKKQQIQTHESFMQKLKDVNEAISIETEKLKGKMNKEWKRKQKQTIEKLEREKEALLKSRGELFGT